MRAKLLLSGLLALALSALNASAWNVSGVVSCPNGNTAAGIVVSITGVGSTATDGNGAYVLELPTNAASYTICVDASTLPAGASASGCSAFSVSDTAEFADVNFGLSGAFCSPPPPPEIAADRWWNDWQDEGPAGVQFRRRGGSWLQPNGGGWGELERR